MKKIVAIAVLIVAGLIGYQYLGAAMDASALKSYIRHTLNAETSPAAAAGLIHGKADELGIPLEKGAVKLTYSDPEEASSGPVAGKVSGKLKVMRITAVATVEYDRPIFFWNKHTVLEETVIFNSSASVRGARTLRY